MSDFFDINTSIGCLVQDEGKSFITFSPEGSEKCLRTMHVCARFHGNPPVTFQSGAKWSDGLTLPSLGPKQERQYTVMHRRI